MWHFTSKAQGALHSFNNYFHFFRKWTASELKVDILFLLAEIVFFFNFNKHLSYNSCRFTENLDSTEIPHITCPQFPLLLIYHTVMVHLSQLSTNIHTINYQLYTVYSTSLELWTECLCLPSPKFMCWSTNLPFHDGWRWGYLEIIGSWG